MEELKLLEKAEVRMLRWIQNISLQDHVRSEKIRAKLGVAQIRDKVDKRDMNMNKRVNE